MDRVINKLNRWENIKEATFTKRLSNQGEAEAKLHKKELKIEKASKNLEENIKERIERIKAKEERWAGKIEMHKHAIRAEENESHKKGQENLRAISKFLDEKRKHTFAQHAETLRSSPLMPVDSSPRSMRTKGMRSTWRPSASDYRVKPKAFNAADEGTSSSGMLP